MDAHQISVSANDALKSTLMTIEIKVNNVRILRARIWIGTKIMMLGAWVIGVGRCEVVEK